MAVDTCMTPKIQEEDDDDDEPIVFRRTKVTPKQNQVNSEIKKVSSQRLDGSSQRHEGSSQKNDGSSQRRDGSSQRQDGSSQRQDASSQRRDGCSQRQDGSSQTRDGSSQRQDGSSQRRNGSSQKHCGPSERPSPGTASPNGQNSTLQKGKMVSSSKSAPLKSPLANPKASTSVPEKPKQPPTQNSRISNNEKKPPAKPNVDSEDSDDDKPLSARLLVSTSALQKSNSHNVAKVHSPHLPSSSMSEKTTISSKKSVEDSEDEGPLSSMIKMTSGGEPSVKKEIEEKPLAYKAKQNGSIKKESEQLNSPKLLNKRPLGDSSTPTHSSAKKPKLSESSVAAKVKQVSVKAEVKTEDDDDDDDDVPIAERLKKAAVSAGTSQPKKKTITKVVSSSLKTSKKSKKIVKKSQYSKSIKLQPSSGDGQKWTTLEHNGVIFPPDYKPHGVKMLYNGQPVDLTPEQEEVATMFAVMKDTEYATKEKFVENFMNDWRGILGRNHIIKKFELCDFTPIYDWHQAEKEKRKQMTTEEKRIAKEEKLKQEEKYMWAIVDGVKEKVGNFRVEPPGLFRGRGEHPKMGKLKKRIRPSDITINIGKGVPIPECPIPGQRWKEVKHDNTVTWLAFWIDPINSKEFKYVFLAASSSLKGQSDKEKYEKARLLKDYIHDIRANYTKDFTNKDLGKRQIAVATYLIDKLALRAGNEKDDDEADTVGCCTLKVENVKLVPPNKLEFDFLGKDSIRYLNTVDVELPVYKAIGQFKNGKNDGEDLFDKLDTSKLNAHLKELMPGLTAKVFRTYNASITLDDQLHKNTKDGDVGVKVVVYNLANKEVAIICNHQRTESKSHTAQMEKLQGNIQKLKIDIDVLEKDLERAKKGKPPLPRLDDKGNEFVPRNLAPDAIHRKINKIYERIEKMERDISTKEELKTIALGTSKINYLDPRISVAWCKRHEVPIEKIFNKSLLAKFAWAMDVDPSFRF
ncbi:DNA topoisomerase 1 alpha-like [Papaver somniferum]|uniref:DNA topoisomerase 1 alpha-like n=1 Tax=Papaver somniferum TaxID=3469 RepID=UPI000E6FCD87|nr:DNA topoisomerase 1 alpha-like [Papaver somniferum]